MNHPKLPTFCALPKTYKSLLNPKGRPIVSGLGTISEKVSIFVDTFLHPFVSSLLSYMKDSINFLQQIKNLVIPSHALLVIIDMEALQQKG